MHSFFKAEWLTIVTTFLFIGSLFGYFYYQELNKADQKTDRYVMQCIHPGKGILDYKLNTSIDTINLNDFEKSTDEDLKTTHYKSPDKSFILDVRDNTIVAIEYYFDPETADNEDANVCIKDLNEWTKGYSETAESIESEGYQHHIYEGLVVIKKTEKIAQDKAPDDDSEEKTEKSVTKNVGVIVLNS